MCKAYETERRSNAGAGTEAQRGFDMLDRDVGLARIQPEGAAVVPATGMIRAEGESTINQRHHSADVLSEIAQREGGIRRDARIVPGHFQGSPGEIGAFETIRCRIVIAPTVKKQ